MVSDRSPGVNDSGGLNIVSSILYSILIEEKRVSSYYYVIHFQKNWDKELAHMEMICAIIYQLTKNLSPEEIERSGFAPYYVDHTLALWPQAASGAPWTATYFQSKGDPITDLHEDLAADGATA